MHSLRNLLHPINELTLDNDQRFHDLEPAILKIAAVTLYSTWNLRIRNGLKEDNKSVFKIHQGIRGTVVSSAKNSDGFPVSGTIASTSKGSPELLDRPDTLQTDSSRGSDNNARALLPDVMNSSKPLHTQTDFQDSSKRIGSRKGAPRWMDGQYKRRQERISTDAKSVAPRKPRFNVPTRNTLSFYIFKEHSAPKTFAHLARHCQHDTS